jgi:hypothetical protein
MKLVGVGFYRGQITLVDECQSQGIFFKHLFSHEFKKRNDKSFAAVVRMNTNRAVLKAFGCIDVKIFEL